MKILFCGDSPTVDTGFGTVARNILGRLYNKGHEIYAMGVNYYGEPFKDPEIQYPVWPVDHGSLDNMYGYAKFWYIEKQVEPDLIFFLNDPWVIEKYLAYRPKSDRTPKMLAYYPTDGGPMKESWVEMLNGFDAQVVYSNFAEKILIESNDGKRPKNAHQIYHGVDTKKFFPVNQSLARMELGLPVDAYIIGMVARNQYRKRFDILVSAFAEFAKDKDDAKLYLHTATNDVGYDIIDLGEQFELGDKLVLTEDVQASKGVPVEALNLIYNSFDVNALISLGDGFGLPVAESMATGCPQLVSGHSCLQELVEGHGGLTVKNAAWMMNTSGFNTWGAVTDVKDLTHKMNILYNNKELRMGLAQDAINFITQEKFTWDYAANKFDDIIKDIFHIIRV